LGRVRGGADRPRGAPFPPSLKLWRRGKIPFGKLRAGLRCAQDDGLRRASVCPPYPPAADLRQKGGGAAYAG